jgi:Tol biopolymer transport system component
MDDKPLWTKDDKHILFERQDYTYNHDARNYTMREDIYIINIDGSSLQKLTDNGISSLTKRGTR